MREMHSKDREENKKQSLISTLMSSKANPKLLNHIDDSNSVFLPRETLYLIDKVIRNRVKKGPISLDDAKSLLIDLERKKELQKLRSAYTAEDEITSYQSRLQREQKVLTNLHTPAKTKSKRPVSAHKNMNSAPNKKYGSKKEFRKAERN